MQARCDSLWKSARRVALALALCCSPLLLPVAQAATGAKNFDHLTTGFALTGQHESARCEDCHVRGIFKGTPAQCAACHTPGALVTAVMIPNNHFPTSQPCSSCHTTATFYGAHFPHSDVASGTCNTCHNGVFAKGKSTNHVSTVMNGKELSCDACHTTASFLTAFLGVPPGHLPITSAQACSNCHDSAKFVPGDMTRSTSHVGTEGRCAICHAPGTTPFTFTIPANMSVLGGPQPVTPMSQAGGTTQGAAGSVVHIPVAASCDACHTNGNFTVNSSLFKGGVMHHAAVTGASCASCHAVSTPFVGGTSAGGKPFQIPGPVGTPGAANHMPINGLDCAASGCHAISDTATSGGTGFATKITPALSAAGHTSVNLACQSCHTIGMAWKGVTTLVTPTALHVPPDNLSGGTVACASCHSPTSFGTNGFKITSSPLMNVAAHTAVASAVPLCTTCHEANAGDLTFQGVLGNIYLRPNTATSGLSRGVGLDPYHGSGIGLTQDCKSCHSTAPPFSSASLPSNHIKLIAGAACADCHAGGYAPGSTTMKHADVSGTCTSCHYTSTVFAGTAPNLGGGQPWQIPGPVGTSGAGNHLPINGKDCAASGCHTAKDPITTTGAGFVTGITPALSAAGHTTVNLSCQTCHTVGMAWKGITTLVTPAAQHVPPDNLSGGTVACASCHSATSFGTNGFKITSSPLMNVAAHAAVAGSVPACTTCHEANAGDLTFQGVLGNIYLRPNTATSGLSKGTGLDPFHGSGNGLTQDCLSCHTTAPPFSSAIVPTGHIKLIAGASCNDCHSGGYSPATTVMKHADASGTCTSCHYTATVFLGSGQGLGGGQPWQISGTVGTPGAGNHFAINAKDCASSGCHSAKDPMTNNGAGFVTGTTPVLSAAGHTTVNLSCQTCHTVGMTWKGVTTMVTPTAQHIPPDNLGSGTVACASCHSATSFGTNGFKLTGTPVMSVAMHTAVASLTCVSCHEANVGDLGFQGITTKIYLRPDTANSGLSKGLNLDVPHGTGNAATQDCVNCHSTAPPFTSIVTPSNHIKLITGAACADCHAAGYGPGVSTMKHADAAGTCTSCHYTTTVFAGTGQGTNGQPWQIPGTVGTAGAGNHIPINGKDCAASGCHTAKDPMTANGAGFVTGVTPALSSAGHTTVNLSCQTCHTVGMAWKGITTLVTPTAQHIPPDNLGSGTVACASCHSATSFGTNGFKITGSPVMSVAMHTAVASAVPLCTTCHEANAGDLTFQGVTTNIYLRPNTGTSGLSKGTGQDPSHSVGNAGTQDCVNCHTTAPPFTNVGLPGNHIKLITPTPSCNDCHAGGYAPGSSTMKHADVSGTCTSCHYTSTVFAGTAPNLGGGQPWQIPGTVGTAGAGNHIPINGKDCAASGCHTAKDPITTTGAGFVTGVTPALSSAGHTTVNLSCQTCHTVGMAWKGITTLVTPTAQHIPPDNLGSGTVACASCHSATSFGTNGFKITSSPVMSVAMHTAVASAVPLCTTCHEANAGDLTFQGVTTNIYLRPNTATSGLSKPAPQDPSHSVGNAGTQDCVNCHSTAPPFTSVATPSNHIKLITGAVCNDCHAAGYSPATTVMKHADASGTCTSCHYTATVFAGSGQGLGGGQPWQISGTVGTPGAGNHIPINAKDCAASGCHTAKDPMTNNGTGFVTGVTPALSSAGHTTVALSCQTCHTVGMTWKGITTMVTPTAQHIPPDNTNAGTVACASCHVATSFGTNGFKLTGTPVMTVAMHSAVSSLSCDTCHESANLQAQDLQFQGITTNIYLRPNNGANSGLSQGTDTSHTGTAATADCGGCHSTSPPFTAGKPAGHINVTAAAVCASCHTSTTSSVVLPMPHTAVVGTCASCHNSATLWAGSVFTPNTTGSGGTFGNTVGTSFRARQIVASPAVGTSGGHIPLVVAGADCNVCHTSTSAFGPGTAMVHTGISSGCATCHAAGSKWYGETYTASPLVTTGNVTLSPLHVPINQGGNPACEKCHSASVFTSFGTTTTVNHSSGGFMTYTGTGNTNNPNRTLVATPKCITCHAPSSAKWYPSSARMSAATMGNHHNSQAGDDCVYCHSTGSFGGAAAAAAVARRPMMRTASGPAVRPTAPGIVPGGTPAPFTHVGVAPGACVSCHAPGGSATAKPANHLPTALSCDACHRTSAWLPALFTHNGVVAGTCASCHVGNWATAKPAKHMLTSRNCDTCHRSTTSWTPETYTHMDLVYSPHSSNVTCISCHATDTEQVVWKYPNFKPGCAGCHGSQFAGPSVRRSKGPVVSRPRVTP